MFTSHGDMSTAPKPVASMARAAQALNLVALLVCTPFDMALYGIT